MWRVELTYKAQQDLANLDRPVRRHIIERLEWFAENFTSTQPSPLHADWKGFYKVRFSSWRVVYSFSTRDSCITVHYIDRRDKVYKRRL